MPSGPERESEPRHGLAKGPLYVVVAEADNHYEDIYVLGVFGNEADAKELRDQADETWGKEWYDHKFTITTVPELNVSLFTDDGKLKGSDEPTPVTSTEPLPHLMVSPAVTVMQELAEAMSHELTASMLEALKDQLRHPATVHIPHIKSLQAGGG